MMTCPLCAATVAMLAHSLRLSCVLNKGEQPEDWKELIADLATVHRDAVRLRSLAPKDQLDQMGTVHRVEVACPN